MRILLLAPHPFYQERGTPIAVDLLLRQLDQRGDDVHVLTYNEGEDRAYSRVTIHRIRPWMKVKGYRPGFSLKKMIADLCMVFAVKRLLRQHAFDLVHAVEESAFLAMLIRRFARIPYIYDMDSLISAQLVEKNTFFYVFVPFVRFIERKMISGALAVIAINESLVTYAHNQGARQTFLLSDVSLLDNYNRCPQGQRSLRGIYNIHGPIVMYIGNLERYQGIDLLLEGFLASQYCAYNAALVVIGGRDEHIEKYRKKLHRREGSNHVFFIGPQPVEYIKYYLEQADIVASPRILGDNTPMKVYSYLDSGCPLIATQLPTHTQVCDQHTALLVEPSPGAFAGGLDTLYASDELRQSLAAHARKLVEKRYSISVFNRSVNEIYNSIEADVER